jgi:hypothetical protein
MGNWQKNAGQKNILANQCSCHPLVVGYWLLGRKDVRDGKDDRWRLLWHFPVSIS